jgi:hypothetical protein
MLQTVPDDETAVFNAEEIIRICQEFQGATPTPESTEEGEDVEIAPTPTSENTEPEG